jgi:starch synthase (maltosyl-transferring)
LQAGGPPAFLTRLVLAATLGANYGIYGPAYELYEHTPAHHGSEEYLDSEKYEIKQWDLDSPQSLAHRIAVINGIRRKNKALQSNDRLHFHEIDNPMLICYSKSTPDLSNVVLTIANLDPFFTQSGWTHIDLSELGITQEQTYSVIDLLNGGRYSWKGPRNYVALTPGAVGAHIFKVER